MDYQVSARKYRPGTFDDVIGQPHVVQTLVNSITTKRIAQAYLFSGSRGVGKTTVARILAKALNCEQGQTGTPCGTCSNCLEIAQGTSVDVMEIDGASNTSVDDVREIRENIKFAAFHGKYRVYIIDEVHMLSNSAFNALLKTLEEPPPHVVFIFATTEIHKIPATILSRCQHYNFRRIARAEIVERLRYVVNQDQIVIEERSLMALARASEGSMRDGLSLLDQAVAFGGKTIVHTDLEALLGAVPQELVRAMIQAFTAQESAAALRVLAHLLDQGHDLRAYCAEVVEYLRNMLVVSVVPSPQEQQGLIEATMEDLAQMAADAKAFSPEQLQELFAIFTQAEDALRLSAHPRFVLETAAVRATRLLRRANEKPAQAMPPGQTPRPLPAPVRVEKPAQPVRANSPPPPSAPKPPQSTASMPAAPLPTRPPGLATAAPARNPLSTPPPARPPLASSEGTVTKPVPAAPSDTARPAVTLNWEQLQEEVAGAFPNIAPFLEIGRLVRVDGHVVTIGFPKQATVARGMIEKPDNIAVLTSMCERLSGQTLRLRVVELTEADFQGHTMAELRVSKEKEQKQVLFERAQAHPVVKQALEIFGAELAEVRPVASQKEIEE
ncbi:MAG: DNA polymerase III subunit gamma/tau [Nitrospiraceae bacterium]|jgi:DNA polymerase-3 subunit gamma/tau|nr:DNA polymerase III subunit gamma/tau [Nitrospira sp.]MDW7648300.1 DNA polymerase III subunit gamma/tau [Nitrospiraceae bacterium]GBL39908.1 DNA polymerase III subunit tau [Nitrospirota bacterium]MBP0122170.1 DNA polymerase III subunit gamma/tau [Nitrospira sp.]MBP0123977.1 DNA polymerase III subunit gamma/tau [Nitrospira sp.]